MKKIVNYEKWKLVKFDVYDSDILLAVMNET